MELQATQGPYNNVLDLQLFPAMSKRHSELLQLYNNTEVSYLIHYPNPNPKPSPNPYPNPDPNSYVNPLLIPIPRRAKNEYGK